MLKRLVVFLSVFFALPAFADAWPTGVGIYQTNGYIGAKDASNNVITNANCQATPLTYNNNASFHFPRGSFVCDFPQAGT